MQQQTPARSTSYIFIFDDDRDNTYAIQNAQTPDLTLGETPFSARPKDLFIPSNKVETSPIVIQFLVSEDLRQWIDMYKWMMKLKNHVGSAYPDQVRTCELVTLDNQNKTLHRLVYGDCFPTNISPLQYSSQGESTSLTFDLTLRYNSFKLVTKNGEIIDDCYKG